MKNRSLALLLCGLILTACALSGCNFLKPGSSAGNKPEETPVPLPAETEPPVGGSTEDKVILINTTGGTILSVCISSNDVEFWGEPLPIPEIMNGASYVFNDFGRDIAPYDKLVDICFSVSGMQLVCNVRGLEIKPGDRIRISLQDDPDHADGQYKIPVFELRHADGNSRIYYGNTRTSVDGTDRKVAGDY